MWPASSSCKRHKAWSQNSNYCSPKQLPAHRLALDPLSGQWAGCDGWPTTKCLELGINNLSLLIHFDLMPISRHTKWQVGTYRVVYKPLWRGCQWFQYTFNMPLEPDSICCTYATFNSYNCCKVYRPSLLSCYANGDFSCPSIQGKLSPTPNTEKGYLCVLWRGH